MRYDQAEVCAGASLGSQRPFLKTESSHSLLSRLHRCGPWSGSAERGKEDIPLIELETVHTTGHEGALFFFLFSSPPGNQDGGEGII